jgi:hypothetical protein
VLTEIVCPVCAEVGAEEICPSGWFVAHEPHRPPPPEKTVPSGRSTATE